MKELKVNNIGDNIIFKSINPYDNLSFNSLKGNDLLDILFLLNQSFVTYRDKLNIEKSTSIGTEIEFENVSAVGRGIISSFILLKGMDWDLKEDGSLLQGLEVTSPILHDDPKCWNELKEICMECSKHGTILSNAGGHVHIGSQILGNDIKNWLNFIRLWAAYENIIIRFLNGEYITSRQSLASFARPVKDNYIEYLDLFKNEKFLKNMLHIINDTRNKGINFFNTDADDNIDYEILGNTIEFRCPNGSINHIIWQNNINLLVKLLMYSKSPNYDLELINRRLEKSKNLDYKLYNEIDIEEALEFSDLIFDNNLDKVYFLIQYFKNFDYAYQPLIKAKKFTK